MARLRATGRQSIKNVNDVIVSNTAPGNPKKGTSWTDTSKTPPVTKIWDGKAWVDKLAEVETVVTEHTETFKDHSAKITSNETAINLRVTQQEYNVYKTQIGSSISRLDSSLKTAESSISTLQGQIALKVEQTDIDKVETEILNRVDEVDSKFSSYSTTQQMTAAINLAKDNITSAVASTYAKQTDVSALTGKVTTLETWSEEATQKISKDGIIATVGNYYAYDTDLTAATNRIANAESVIEQHTTDISLTVKERDITGNYIIGKINLSGTTALIAAKNIDLSGYVTISSLATAGQTTINGSNIKTGTISADRLDVNGLFAKDITATGTIRGVNLAGATGSFTGDVTATTIAAKETYSIYNETNASKKNIVISGSSWTTNEGFGALFIGTDVSKARNDEGNINSAYIKIINSGIGLCGDVSMNNKIIVYDAATFYSQVSAPKYYENGTLLSSKYAAASHNHPLKWAIANGDILLGISGDGKYIRSYWNDGSLADNTMCLGSSNDRFSGLFLSGDVNILANKYIEFNNVRTLSRTTANNIYLGDYNKNTIANCYIVANNVYKTTSSGNTSLSDQRMKRDVKNILKAKEFIMSLAPKLFKFTDGTSDRYHSGFIAQHTQQVMLQTTGDFGVFVKIPICPEEIPYDANNESTYTCALRYEEFIAPMVSVAQEHEARITSVEIKQDSETKRTESLEMQLHYAFELIEKLKKQLKQIQA